MRINNSVRVKISIHALREEGDSRLLWKTRRNLYFYPRPPRGGRQPLPARKRKIV